MSSQPTRRTFIKQAALATAAIGATTPGRAADAPAGSPTAAPAGGSPPRRGANDRIRLGLIGCGGLGYAFHIPRLMEMSREPKTNIELAAVCDIYEPRKLRAREATGAELFHDYRKLLDRSDIDGVVIVTPDHWHAKMAIDAMEAGKDVHVEKPMTLHWEQAKQVYQTSERLGRVVQVGAEGTSRDMFWQARKLVESGAIGKVVWVSGGVYRNDPGGDWNWPMDPDCSPANLDWDAFLGPAPKRPFEPERYFRYRKFWDYSGGVAHDLIAHVLAATQISIGAEFPTRVSAAGGLYVHHDRETPDTFSMQVEYPGQYLCTFVCTQTTEQGERLVIRGNKGTIRFPQQHDQKGQVFVTPEKAYEKEVKELTVNAQPRIDHDRNFVECMRTRSKPHYDALTGYKAMVALDLAVRSWREGRMFTFDPQKQEIVA